MRRHTRLVAALAAVTAPLVALGFAVAPAASAGTWQGRNVLPRQVFAPYVETYDTTGGGPAALSQESGARYLSLAFLQTAQAGSCTAYWNGDTSEPISSASFGSDISAVQAAGGNVIPSFGGYAADTTGTELADSCTSVSAIAQVYEKVITTYHAPRIDLDIEGTSLTDTAGINRRNEAIAMVESWAAARGISIQFSYTLPTPTTGLDSADDALLANAIPSCPHRPSRPGTAECTTRMDALPSLTAHTSLVGNLPFHAWKGTLSCLTASIVEDGRAHCRARQTGLRDPAMHDADLGHP